MDQRVTEVIARLQISLACDLRADHLAHDLGLSVSRLQHLFKNETGTTLVKYKRKLRIERACRLLETTRLSIKQIVSEVGIRDTSHFVRDFEKAQGISPKRYRMNFLSEQTEKAVALDWQSKPKSEEPNKRSRSAGFNSEK